MKANMRPSEASTPTIAQSNPAPRRQRDQSNHRAEGTRYRPKKMKLDPSEAFAAKPVVSAARRPMPKMPAYIASHENDPDAPVGESRCPG